MNFMRKFDDKSVATSYSNRNINVTRNEIIIISRSRKRSKKKLTN